MHFPAEAAAPSEPGAPLTLEARLRAELDAVHRSTSWRVTAPLRAIGRRLRG
jgi:hypothetical protein